MPESSLTKRLEAQVTVHEGTYFSKRCAGKEPSDGMYLSCTKMLLRQLRFELKHSAAHVQFFDNTDAVVKYSCSILMYFAGQACVCCRYLRKVLLTRCSRLKRTVLKKTLNTAQKLRSAQQKNRRLSHKVSDLKDQLCKIQKENASKPEEILEAEISSLSPKQQECVRQCFSAAKKKNSKGNVYSKAWILECIFMKMKSPKLY